MAVLSAVACVTVAVVAAIFIHTTSMLTAAVSVCSAFVDV